MPGFTGAWNFFVWIYISWFCELAWRCILKAYRKRKAAIQSVDDETESVTSDDERPEDKDHSETAETYISKIKRRGFRRKPEVKFNKDAFNRDIGGSKSSIFGGRTNLSELHAGAEKGLESSDDGFKKVTTYYDKSGKLVYKKEKDVMAPPPTVQKPNLESLDPLKPSFRLKPQPPSWDQEEYKAYIEGSDDKFAAAKNRVDADIDKAFNEIYDSLPKM